MPTRQLMNTFQQQVLNKEDKLNQFRDKVIRQLMKCNTMEELDMVLGQASDSIGQSPDKQNKAMLIGHDITEGITAANKAIEGNPEPLDTL